MCLSALQLIDTAVMYGNEAEIGKALSDQLKAGKVQREDLFITTKLNNSPQQHSEEGVEPAIRESLQKLQLDYVDLVLIHWPVTEQPTQDRGNVHPPIQACVGYLRRPGQQTFAVKLSCIPAFSFVQSTGQQQLPVQILLGGPTGQADMQGTWRGLEAAVDKGLVRSIGISNFSPQKTDAWFKDARIFPAVNQVVLDDTGQLKLLPTCKLSWILQPDKLE